MEKGNGIFRAKGMRAGKGSFKAAIFSDTTIIDCELDGANYEDSNMEGIRIGDSFLDHANFKGVNLKGAIINISHAVKYVLMKQI